jgi:hypothetical protein
VHNNVIRLERPKTLRERELTLNQAEGLLDDKVIRKLPILLNLTNEESRSLGFGERSIK